MLQVQEGQQVCTERVGGAGGLGLMRLVMGCTGIEGIGIAAQWAGMEIVGQIEIDEFCNKILEKYWSAVKRMKNMFDVKGDEFGTVDIFAAGIPCQPFSHAGQRKGSSDDRYLWPETLRIIRTMQPTWVVIENVDGIGTMEQSDYEIDLEGETTICTEADMVLETIRKDFESAGYQTLMLEIPACAVGAAHGRARYFIVGYSKRKGLQGHKRLMVGTTPIITGPDKIMGYTECSRLSGESRRGTGQEFEDGYCGSEKGVMADTISQRLQTGGGSGSNGIQKQTKAKHGKSSQSSCYRAESNRAGIESGMGGMLDGLSSRIHGFRQPAYMGQPQYDWEPSRVAAGVKNRTNRLKALGNAVHPLQIYPILQIIYWIENGVS
jgi:DNA (cytosine-5)-methyltransferase 1